MKILPVLDILGGEVVRGVGGRRAEYRPIVSRLTSSSEPLTVAGAFREHLGLICLYVADLDAIVERKPQVALHQELEDAGFSLWLDAGLRTSAEVLNPPAKREGARSAVSRSPHHQGDKILVAGLETLAGPDELRQLIGHLGSEHVVFSLDLKGGRVLGEKLAWRSQDPWDIAQEAIEACGTRRVLVLDLAHVGVDGGVGTEALCGCLIRHYPKVEVATGGGVRGRDDLLRLRDLGVGVALVASALHDGRLCWEDIQGLE